ncbi:DUF3159 domain-containing protein [Pseudonocardia cypriaca]|uniref:Uncharacterized protein DUF3159 n=1 Tax=Pseudonocardia cypriaca TaxID=882449 RepID=A0A543GCK5_9PSEU|nr:DUF3159 domain-containing protein [Pseudonocardia cypriaca]TQM43791.1 uncharacterized protein DUF3159 [Pseudonocardia cypriaca]
MTEQQHPDQNRNQDPIDQEKPTPAASASPEPARTREQVVLDRMGGRRGFIYSTIPIVVFVTANLFLPLVATLGIAVSVGGALTAIRIIRGERWTSAAAGLVGVAVAATIVGLTGSAKNYFLLGIWAYFAGFVIAVVSVLIRWPVSGIIWNFLHAGKYRWRSDRSVMRAHSLATLAAAAVLGSRFVIQQWLYLADSTSGLGIARIAMGTPLSALVAVVGFWAFRHSSKQLIKRPDHAPEVPGDGRR